MSFFPNDPTKYRPTRLILQVEVLREMDRAIQEGIGGFEDRHELANELLEQGLIGLRYPEGQDPIPPTAKSESELESQADTPVRHEIESISELIRTVEAPPTDLVRIGTPSSPGFTVENELAIIPEEPMFGMHNRDAPTAWALARLAAATPEGPVPLDEFYEETTSEAWNLATALESLEVPGDQKLAVMLPRNRDKPQSAAQGFKAFALGQVARKPDAQGKLAVSGPLFQWHAVGIVGDAKKPSIGLTESGWQLTEIFGSLDFNVPHQEKIALGFLTHLELHAASDFWGFHAALEGANDGLGRVALGEHFQTRLAKDFPEADWKGSVAESIASGYVSRSRAWGLMEPKLRNGSYSLTQIGKRAFEGLSEQKNNDNRRSSRRLGEG